MGEFHLLFLPDKRLFGATPTNSLRSGESSWIPFSAFSEIAWGDAGDPSELIEIFGFMFA